MRTAISEFQEANEWLASQGCHGRWDYRAVTAQLKWLAGLFVHTRPNQHCAMIGEFHNGAGQLPYYRDRDIGALILEFIGDEIPDTTLRLFLYSEARQRARWCVKSASTEDEEAARTRHLDALDEKILLLSPVAECSQASRGSGFHASRADPW